MTRAIVSIMFGIFTLTACATHSTSAPQPSLTKNATVSGYSILITKNDSLYIDGKKTELSELVSKLKENGATESSRIVIHASKNLSYSTVSAVLNELASARFNKVSFEVIK
jgi:biopolymer transport protein ExbD